MIIGPNGTGKSTIVCAIVLGLTGKEGIIEIVLKGEGGKRWTIKRKIECGSEKSEWWLDGERL
jgi:ABC-type Mn2+/Zn2+ transport system ATPase subunit